MSPPLGEEALGFCSVMWEDEGWFFFPLSLNPCCLAGYAPVFALQQTTLQNCTKRWFSHLVLSVLIRPLSQQSCLWRDWYKSHGCSSSELLPDEEPESEMPSIWGVSKVVAKWGKAVMLLRPWDYFAVLFPYNYNSAVSYIAIVASVHCPSVAWTHVKDRECGSGQIASW